MLNSSTHHKALLYETQALIDDTGVNQNQSMIDKQKNKKAGENVALASKIAGAIEASTFSAAEIAGKCEVTPQAVNGWKTTGRISKDMLSKLAHELGLPLSHFIPGADSQNIVTAQEIIELATAYASASEKDRKLIMSSAKTAAKRAGRQRQDVVPN